MEDNFKVGMGMLICPICGKVIEDDSVILMNTELTKQAAKNVEKLHNQVVGVSENACEDCVNNSEKAFFILEMNEEEKQPTGRYVGISKESEFYANFKNDFKDFILTTQNNVKYSYMDREVFGQLFENVTFKSPN